MANLAMKVVFLMFINVCCCVKWLIENPDFNSTQFWKSDHKPCSNDVIVFPINFKSAIILPRNISIGGITMPATGALIFPEQASMNINDTLNKEHGQNDCGKHSIKNYAYVKNPKIIRWFDPKNWKSVNNSVAQSMTSLIQGLPCNNETIVISLSGSVSLDFEGVNTLYIGQLNLGGTMVSRSYITQLLTTDIGSILFRNVSNMAINLNSRSKMCGCHLNSGQFLKTACNNINHLCKEPRCEGALTPYGACCSLCGVIFTLEVENCNEEMISKLHSLVSKKLKELNQEEYIDFYINFIQLTVIKKALQLVIKDRKESMNKSSFFAHYLNESINWSKDFESKYEVHLSFSGIPTSGNISTFWYLITFILCAVIGFTICFGILSGDGRVNTCWNWIATKYNTLISTSNALVYRLYDNSSQHDNSENVVVGFDVQTETVSPNAFNNPIYEDENIV